MSQSEEKHTYKQGHDKYSTATHERRKAESDAGFVLPFVKPTDRILDVGCGPGTITTGFISYATEGSVIGIDISPEVLEKAKGLAAQAKILSEGPGSVSFSEANVLERLPFNDDTFDVVFASQVLGHIPLPDLPVKALSEMRRVLKPGGILATRDACASHAFPRSLDMHRRVFARQNKVFSGRDMDEDVVATLMPALYREAGFDNDGGKVRVGGSTSITYSKEDRKWMAARMGGMLRKESAFHKNWLAAGFTEGEVEDTVHAIETWADTEDAWYVAMQLEMLAWK